MAIFKKHNKFETSYKLSPKIGHKIVTVCVIKIRKINVFKPISTKKSWNLGFRTLLKCTLSKLESFFRILLICTFFFKQNIFLVFFLKKKVQLETKTMFYKLQFLGKNQYRQSVTPRHTNIHQKYAKKTTMQFSV